MQEFHELIKNFDKIRDYMRQFYVYGFKVRSDFDAKSARTYDNERRRIESWLGDYTRSGYTAKGKHLYISVDGKTIPRNPLYAAWKSKTFTDNDLLLHFFLTDLLTENEQGMTAGELCDSIVASYGCVFDSQTIRLKLKEYESLGLLFSEKKGKALFYRLAPDLPCEKGAAAGEADPSHGLWERILTAVKFFRKRFPSVLWEARFWIGAVPGIPYFNGSIISSSIHWRTASFRTHSALSGRNALYVWKTKAAAAESLRLWKGSL